MLSIILIIITSIFFIGIIGQTKAKMSGRKGAGILQPVKDIIRLLKKGNVYSTASSIIFQIAPTIYFASIVCAMFFVPFDEHAGLISFNGDFVFFAYLLGIGKFFLIINALDVASPFEGMGANREALYSMLIEPAFFVLAGSLALLTGYTSFHEIFTHLHFTSAFSYLIGILAAYLIVQIAMVENSRLPVDDPRTHLELTMVHEVMVLDNSGFDLGLIQIATALKFAIYGTFIANFITPEEWSLWAEFVIFFAIQFVFAVVVGLLESFRARKKMQKNPQFIMTLSSVAVLIFLTALIITKKIIQ